MSSGGKNLSLAFTVSIPGITLNAFSQFRQDAFLVAVADFLDFAEAALEYTDIEDGDQSVLSHFLLKQITIEESKNTEHLLSNFASQSPDIGGFSCCIIADVKVVGAPKRKSVVQERADASLLKRQELAAQKEAVLKLAQQREEEALKNVASVDQHKKEKALVSKNRAEAAQHAREQSMARKLLIIERVPDLDDSIIKLIHEKFQLALNNHHDPKKFFHAYTQNYEKDMRHKLTLADLFDCIRDEVKISDKELSDENLDKVIDMFDDGNETDLVLISELIEFFSGGLPTHIASAENIAKKKKTKKETQDKFRWVQSTKVMFSLGLTKTGDYIRKSKLAIENARAAEAIMKADRLKKLEQKEEEAARAKVVADLMSKSIGLKVDDPSAGDIVDHWYVPEKVAFQVAVWRVQQQHKLEKKLRKQKKEERKKSLAKKTIFKFRAKVNKSKNRESETDELERKVRESFDAAPLQDSDGRALGVPL